MKFLVADDEILVRITVQKLLNDLGISNENILTADCGRSMVEILNTNCINIAFVDISMPDISGLEAIEQCLHSSPSTSFYILTGFEKFEYAAQAIRLGVKDFLLKPLSQQTLSNILQREQSSFELKKKNMRDFYASKITGILLGENTQEDYSDLYCLPCFCACDNPGMPNLEILFQIESSYHSIKTILIPMTGYVYIAFCTLGNQFSTATLSDIRELLLQTLNQKENALITFFYYNAFVPFEKIKQIFGHLQEYAPYRVISGIGRLYLYNPKLISSNKSGIKLAGLLCRLSEGFSANSYLECSRIIPQILSEMNGLPVYGNVSLLQNINTYISAVFPNPANKLLTPSDFSVYLETLSASLLNKNVPEEFSIKPVLSYIDEHYTEDISVNTLASLFRVSPNYLSTRFKKDTGIKFTDYITGLRISKAKQLLTETELQVKEIASRIGYFTTSHFIRTFVKLEGITPLEFRNKYRT